MSVFVCVFRGLSLQLCVCLCVCVCVPDLESLASVHFLLHCFRVKGIVHKKKKTESSFTCHHADGMSGEAS